MRTFYRLALLSASAMPVAACVSNDDLRQEIGVIETRVQGIESEIAAGTAGIGQPGKDLRTRFAYRPLVAWASAFSARPADERTIRFRQTARDGDLYKQSHRCRLFGTKRDGKRAWIHESDSTKIDVLIGRLAVEPQSDGLLLRTDLDLAARTQAAANFRPRCVDTSVGGNIGVTASASPSGAMRLLLNPGPGGPPHYRLALVSPDTVGLEMRADFDWFRVGWTIPFKGLARDIAEGELDLMHAREGKIVMPDGTTRTYRLSTVAPALETDTQAVSFSTDLDLAVEGEGR